MNDTDVPPQPVSLERTDEGAIRIVWDDGRATVWAAAELRRRCPCATCREKKRSESERAQRPGPVGLPVLRAAEARPLRIEAMRPVGNYAYNIAFSDGHGSGIYQLARLYEGPSG